MDVRPIQKDNNKNENMSNMKYDEHKKTMIKKDDDKSKQ